MKDLAEKYLHANFLENWCTKFEEEEVVVQKPAKVKRRKSMGLVGAMLAMDTEEEEIEEEECVEIEGILMQGKSTPSEVDKYLQLPQVSHITDDGKDLDILAWWKSQSAMLPCLSKMARQYLSLPCSSAGIEAVLIVNACIAKLACIFSYPSYPSFTLQVRRDCFLPQGKCTTILGSELWRNL